MLIASVPAYFDQPATELASYRAGKRQEREKQEQLAREILAHPDSQLASDVAQEWARSVLSSPTAIINANRGDGSSPG
jgi:hypothetical protein